MKYCSCYEAKWAFRVPANEGLLYFNDQVLPGDVVGFYHAGGSSVPYDYYDEGCNHLVLVISGTQDVAVGNDYTFSEVTGQDCRDYSLNVQIRRYTL